MKEFTRQGYLVRVIRANCHHMAELNSMMLMQKLHVAEIAGL